MIKEKVCYVSLDPKREEKEWMNSYHKSDAKAMDYALPDGHKIKVRIVLGYHSCWGYNNANEHTSQDRPRTLPCA
jgi:hypothetical protein